MSAFWIGTIVGFTVSQAWTVIDTWHDERRKTRDLRVREEKRTRELWEKMHGGES
jgi:hypothetical protein